MKYRINKNSELSKKGKRLFVVYIYKDFDNYNGLIEKFLVFSKLRTQIPFDFEVWVFQNKKPDFSRIFIDNGGKLINLGFRWGSNPLIILKLVFLLRKRRPDVVQTFILKPNIYGIVAASLAKVPVRIATELTLMNQAHTDIRRFRDKILYRLYKYLTKLCDQVVCISNSIKTELLKLRLFCGVSVIYPPLDIEKIKYTGDVKQEREVDNDVVIGIVARLSEEKGHNELLTAFSALAGVYKNIRLLIVGEGPLRKELESRSEKLGINDKVIFTGFQKDINKYLEMMDIFVLPSRTEGLGISVLEAMAKGLPVIATRVGGIPEIVDNNKTGILVDYKRIDQLVSALSCLIENRDIRLEYGKRGQEKVTNRFSYGKFINEHYDLYISLYKKK